MHAIDLYKVFYDPSVNHFVSPQLRKELFNECFPGFFENATKLSIISQQKAVKNPESIDADAQCVDLHAKEKQEISPLLFCYFVILEANDNPYTV